ncbi:hypothetical protein HZC21_06395 [Candidatus Peregrinibacteria bacterium]|nr:hypothetical protein [Candidatus Peregrinibacteria bacterium]
MKNYAKISIFIILTAALIFAAVNLSPSKSFAQRSRLDRLDEDYCPPEICENDLGNVLDDSEEECLPGICGDLDDENPYLDTGDDMDDELPRSDLPDNDLSDDRLPRNDLPDNDLPDNDLPDNDLPDDGLPDDGLPDVKPEIQPKVQKNIRKPVERELKEEPKEESKIKDAEDIENSIAEFIKDISDTEKPSAEEFPAEKPPADIILEIPEEFVELSEEKLAEEIEEVILEQDEDQLKEKQKEEQRIVQELQALVDQSPAFQQIIPSISRGSAAPIIKDVNGNGIPDNVEKDAGIDPSKVDKGLVKTKTELAAKKVKLTKQGKSKKEIQAIIKQELKKKKTERKKEIIRQAAEKKFKQKITYSAQDTNGDGVSDEVEVIFGLDPKEKAVPRAEFSSVEKKIYGIQESEVGKKCTMNVRSGDKLSSKGFTILAACPKKQPFTLYSIDKKGNEIALATKTASDNSKLVFTVNEKFKTGKYVFQIRPAKIKRKAFWPSDFFSAGIANAQTETGIEKSDPVLLDVVEDTDVVQPVVQRIENIEVSRVRDIKVAATADGRIHVTGTTDLDTMIIGTFESAVFTSALLADVENGMFEVTSPQALEAGQHEVVIYATRPEDKVFSPPVKLSFSIIETAKAAPIEEARPAAPSNEEAGFPVMPVAAGGIILALIGVFVFYKKSV